MVLIIRCVCVIKMDDAVNKWQRPCSAILLEAKTELLKLCILILMIRLLLLMITSLISIGRMQYATHLFSTYKIQQRGCRSKHCLVHAQFLLFSWLTQACLLLNTIYLLSKY